MPAPLQRLRQGLLRYETGDKIMAQVLTCAANHGSQDVLVALVIESGVLSTVNILDVLAPLNAAELPPNVQTSLQLKEVPLANNRSYDSWRGGRLATPSSHCNPARLMLPVVSLAKTTEVIRAAEWSSKTYLETEADVQTIDCELRAEFLATVCSGQLARVR